MKRTAIIAGWLLTLAAAYLAGRHMDRGPQLVDPDVDADDPVRQSFSSSQSPSIETTVQNPVELAESLVAQGRPYDAIAVLESYLASEAHDARALFLMSDLRQMTGEVDLALTPLFAVLSFPATPEIGERARHRLLLLINAREQQLINAEDLFGLVAYFESLVAAEPGYDGHRLKLVRWLLRSDQIDAAAQLLRQVGLVGVTPEEIEALQHEIELARSALPIERIGAAMYTRATLVGARRTEELKLLIDTGATMSGMRAALLKRLGAHRISAGVRVHTANGVVTLPVYRIRELRIGALTLKDMDVLGFSDLPRDTEGLLGMDVLGRLSGGVPAPVGRP